MFEDELQDLLEDLGLTETTVKRWKKNYKLTVDGYFAILKKQDFCCAVCKRSQSMFDKWLFVDHDHSCCSGNSFTCGKCVRGLLCHYCNSGLGCFEDNLERLEQAKEYLVNNKPKT